MVAAPDLMGWTAPERHLCARVEGVVTNTRKEPSTMQVSTIGFDLAKQVFQVHGVDADGVVVLRRRLRRSEVVSFSARCLVVWSALKHVQRLTIGPASYRRSGMK